MCMTYRTKAHTKEHIWKSYPSSRMTVSSLFWSNIASNPNSAVSVEDLYLLW